MGGAIKFKHYFSHGAEAREKVFGNLNGNFLKKSQITIALSGRLI